ncbi:MAG TPA: hypothetical protein VJW94_19985 [Candidatus Acidoferrum sp.]|nr:hypothetical protein [Candidatus Acidoferrum sp.]
MKKTVTAAVLAVATAFGLAGAVFVSRMAADDDDHHDRHFRFAEDSLVLSKSVYAGNASTVIVGEALPPGCMGGATGLTVQVPLIAGGTTPVAVPCGFASDNGEYPNDQDTHNVWNNAVTDGSFGITSPIFLDNITEDGWVLGTLPIPSDKLVTSFSSKSELALNLSADGKSLTFVGYHGGVGCGGTDVSPTAPNLIDVSNSNTPGICDPTNPVISSLQSTPNIPTAFYRAVAEVDADGHLSITDGNAYSGDNGRAAIKASNGNYYMAGNDNNGNIGKKQLALTVPGFELINATGAELLLPGLIPPVPPNVAMIGRLEFESTDKPGKDTNFRGITIFNNTVYVSKGSGGNGINSVFQEGTAGTLPTGTAAELATVPLTILPGFPNTEASTSTNFPFGMFFANANTLYVCDEGDGTYVTPPVNGNVADAQSQATAGLQKWVLENGVWTMVYVLQNGLNIGVQYSVDHYPASIDPATGGCRNIAGRVNHDGTVTIWAITSTVSANGDSGADPNKLVKVTDQISATTLPSAGSWLGTFQTVRSARAGEVFRGVAFAPASNHDDHHGQW